MSTNTMQDTVNAVKAHPELAITANDTMNAIYSRSSTDREFRIKLLSDPQAALSEYAGRDVGSVNVKFVEKQGDVTVVLPKLVDPAAELSEAELETVAGGATPVLIVTSSTECIASVLAVSAAVTHWLE